MIYDADSIAWKNIAYKISRFGLPAHKLKIMIFNQYHTRAKWEL